MTTPGRRKSNMSLREAASVVFGLAAVLPVLLFVHLLSRANMLQHTDVQIGLIFAVAVSALGFVMFRRMVGQIARLAEERHLEIESSPERGTTVRMSLPVASASPALDGKPDKAGPARPAVG